MSSIAEDLTITHTRPATERWADIAEEVNAHGKLIVTEDDQSKFVVMSFDEFSKIRENLMDRGLDKVRAEIDRQVAVMNSPGAKERMRAFMDSTPQEFADSANAAERRQRDR